MLPSEQGIELQQPFCIDFSELDLSDCIEIDVEVTTEQDKQKFNRAKQKRETDRLIRESLDCGDMDGEYR